jgi:dihydroorotate dehydrogenase electron transfer subunit
MKSALLFLGGKGRDDVLCVEDFESLGIEVRVATEDGSLGCRGLVSDLMLDYLESGNYGLPSRTHCFACGPESMLKEVARIAGQKGIPCQVSMESRMACGLGACLGCVVKTRANVQNLKSEHNLTRDDQQLITGYKRVCKDGPIFDSNEVIWE